MEIVVVLYISILTVFAIFLNLTYQLKDCRNYSNNGLSSGLSYYLRPQFSCFFSRNLFSDSNDNIIMLAL